MGADQINYCLTLDYELFGSGKGDVFRHMIEPTTRLLALCEKAGIRLTIFFEVVEYWRLKEMCEQGEFMGYEKNPVEAIEKQLVEAFGRGHDVQLHLHPQWIDARYENGKWLLNLQYWRLPEVPLETNGRISMGLNQLIGEGKLTIERLLQPLDSTYRCNILRAGGYNVDPSKDLIKVLRKYDFVADSSVVYGAVMDTPLSRYDYSGISHDTAYWFSNGKSIVDVNSGNVGILELPVFAQPLRRIAKFDSVRLRSALNNRPYAMEKFRSNAIGKSKWETIQSFWDKEAVTWDFCLFSSRKMKAFLKNARQIAACSRYPFHPFVLVGHPKDFFYPNALNTLIRHTQKKGGEFLTLSELVRRVRKGQEERNTNSNKTLKV